MKFAELKKLKVGDKVAILSPSFAAPGAWPKVYELGLQRIKDVFGLEAVEYPSTRKIGASKEERMADLISAFENPEIKAVIATIGGDDQVTYIKRLPLEPFKNNPKPFFGYSDNTHFENFLWLNGIASYYGGSIFTQFARGGEMDSFTIDYLKKAFFENDTCEIKSSEDYNDIGMDWGNDENLNKKRVYEKNDGWVWNGENDGFGVTWGGCLESIDEILRHGIQIPALEEFENIMLIIETSEEIPSADYVNRVFRALGERGILGKIKGILVGRAKVWEFGKEKNKEEKEIYRKKQQDTIIKIVRAYNKDIPIVQNLDFGHTDPQIPFPYGKEAKIDSQNKKIFVDF